MPVKRHKALNGCCQAKTKSGTRCAAPAVRGTRLCSLHSDPKRAAELGRKGGMRNRHIYEIDDKEVVPPQNAFDVTSCNLNAL